MKNTIKNIEENYKFLKKAVTKEGFIELYFADLPQKKTCLECFNQLNEKYYQITGEYRYSNFNSFNNQLSKSYNK